MARRTSLFVWSMLVVRATPARTALLSWVFGPSSWLLVDRIEKMPHGSISYAMTQKVLINIVYTPPYPILMSNTDGTPHRVAVHMINRSPGLCSGAALHERQQLFHIFITPGLLPSLNKGGNLLHRFVAICNPKITPPVQEHRKNSPPHIPYEGLSTRTVYLRCSVPLVPAAMETPNLRLLPYPSSCSCSTYTIICVSTSLVDKSFPSPLNDHHD